MNLNRYNFKFLTENDAIEPNYVNLYFTNFCELYNRCANVFKYKNLPVTVPEYILKKLLILFGRCFFIKENDKIIIDKGENGGHLDLYHRPLTTLIINPYDNINKEFQIYYENNIEDLNVYDDAVKNFDICGILKNDKSQIGLYGIISKYSYLITHAEISLSLASIQSRAHGIASGVGDKGQRELQVFYENLLKGKIYSLKEEPIDENTYKVLPFMDRVNDTISELINLKQFYFSEFLNEIGINTNINRKKAQQNNIELEITDDISDSLVDEMFETQKADIEIINNLFNLNIEIEKNYTEHNNKNKETVDETVDENDEPIDETKGGEENDKMEI